MRHRDAPAHTPGAEEWSANSPAVEVETLVDDQGQSYVALLRHPAYPFACQVPAVSDKLPERLREVAIDYLRRIETRQGIAPIASKFQRRDSTGFGWLDLGWGQGVASKAQDPQASFWVERAEGCADDDDGDVGPAIDRTAVLLATYRARGGDKRQFSLGSGVGLSVVMHVGMASNGQHAVRITGASFSGPLGSVINGVDVEKCLAYGERARLAAAAALGFNPRTTALTGLEPSTGGTVRVSGTAWGLTGKAGKVFAWAARYEKAGGRIQREFVAEQVAHATQGVIRAFKQDPASCGTVATIRSRRATRRGSLLDTYRHPATRLPPDAPPFVPGGMPRKLLVSPGAKPWFAVRQSLLGKDPAQADPTVIQSVPSDTLALRGDDLAAVHAYLRGDELFQRLVAYGLRPAKYFKFARLPLLLRHHSPLRGAADGQAVNADVRPAQSGSASPSLAPTALRPQLEARFGAANLRHRDIERADAGRPRARPQVLGLAADPRWAWHEFGHVLSFAATGVLEFGFAHSAGDALAAILGDPDSALSQDGRVRMLTFPWVAIGRRHDRPALRGWCWCGPRNTRRQTPLAAGKPFFTGYFAEQLLSSSLFRLYRSIGGDTFGSRDMRCAAADYAVYLVMRAMALLGPVSTVPAASPDHFVSALIHADIGTGAWTVTTPWPQGAPNPHPRVGGAVHKVVRWAFEQQGLYAAAMPRAVVEGIGQPPAADVYVAGLHNAERAAGGYDPVALDWSADPDQPPPGWHTDDQAVWWQAGRLHVKVSNRGTQPVSGVQARAWAAPADVLPLQWQPLNLVPSGVGALSAAGSTTFEFDGPASSSPPSTAWLVLAAAGCTGDPSNLDPLTLLPCAVGGPPGSRRLLTDLVACDNNLGLRVMRLPP